MTTIEGLATIEDMTTSTVLSLFLVFEGFQIQDIVSQIQFQLVFLQIEMTISD